MNPSLRGVRKILTFFVTLVQKSVTGKIIITFIFSNNKFFHLLKLFLEFSKFCEIEFQCLVDKEDLAELLGFVYQGDKKNKLGQQYRSLGV